MMGFKSKVSKGGGISHLFVCILFFSNLPRNLPSLHFVKLVEILKRSPKGPLIFWDFRCDPIIPTPAVVRSTMRFRAWHERPVLLWYLERLGVCLRNWSESRFNHLGKQMTSRGATILLQNSHVSHHFLTARDSQDTVYRHRTHISTLWMLAHHPISIGEYLHQYLTSVAPCSLKSCSGR